MAIQRGPIVNALITPDPDFADRVKRSFSRQAFINYVGAELVHVGAGEVDIRLPRNGDLAQQYGYVHGGVLTSIADAAAGYAALTVGPADYGVLTTELKINFLRPGRGVYQTARARVIKPGRTLTICSCDVYDNVSDENVHILTGLVTMMHVAG
ncbi:MAG: PaaI family thioesterase, partial [Hyphomicrobiaceae bacterium]